jgi:multidrug efflux pump subunit AcrA (membrane-fusion protein)
MIKRIVLMIDTLNSRFGLASVSHNRLAFLCVVLALAGCGKPPARPPEKALVRTATVKPLSSADSDGEASYLALVKFDHETDLSFKVGGIVVSVGPTAGTDWDEGTRAKAGTVLAELKQADFTNALNSARARRELAVKSLDVFASCVRRMPFPSRNWMLPKPTVRLSRPNWTRRSKTCGIRAW